MTSPRLSAIVAAVALTGGLLSFAPAAQAADYLPNAKFTHGVKGWGKSSNARISISRKSHQATLTPKSRRGFKVIDVTSRGTGTPMSRGSKVTVKTKARVTQSGRKVTFQLREIAPNGSIVQRKTDSRKRGSKSWHTYGRQMTTKVQGSRISVAVWTNVTRKNSLKVKSFSTQVKRGDGSSAPAPSGTPGPGSVSIGNGLLSLPNSASDWVNSHSGDARAARIRSKIVGKADGQWILGDAYWKQNLDGWLAAARAQDKALPLVLYNIPKRNDGLSGPQGAANLGAYKTWIDQVVEKIGTARVVAVVEPDALWFVDRQTPPGTAAYTERIEAMRYATSRLSSLPNVKVYVEAGTSSRSITPQRMAELLKTVGASNKVGYAVNVSAFGPEKEISLWAKEIRDSLQARGVTNPRFVVDTARNGNPSWPPPHEWCNPAGRKLGFAPGIVNADNGRDMNIWIKGPGTSDGDCGVGRGTTGGQFMPQVAYDMAG